jgi:hypothetical protein
MMFRDQMVSYHANAHSTYGWWLIGDASMIYGAYLLANQAGIFIGIGVALIAHSAAAHVARFMWPMRTWAAYKISSAQRAGCGLTVPNRRTVGRRGDSGGYPRWHSRRTHDCTPAPGGERLSAYADLRAQRARNHHSRA